MRAKIYYTSRQNYMRIRELRFGKELTAESQSTQSVFIISFAAETPANESQHAFGNLSTIEACPLGLEFIPFRPLSEKE